MKRNLLKVYFDGDSGEFVLRNDAGFQRPSEVTDTEDVSYVSSPYIPGCLRKTDRPCSSNFEKRHMSAKGSSNIRDELDEAIVLQKVEVCVAEFIPFGANQIIALNEKLGALDRCQGGFFTSMIDKDPTNVKFEIPAGLSALCNATMFFNL